jgi:PIN domain nuclease of toxin-antitoxin system
MLEARALIHVDTHVLVWLYGGEVEELTDVGGELIETEEVFVSPMAVLELQFWYEIRRTTVTGREIVEDLASRIGLRVASTPFALIVERAASLQWTRDPFDRVIVANAIADGARLLTKDRTILKYEDGAVWDRAKPKRRKR